MAQKSYDLKVDRSLIDPNFDGYKLSLESLPISQISLQTDLDEPKLSNELYSYQHLKAFGIHNQLYVDPWNTNAVWFVDHKWQILKSSLASPLGVSLMPSKVMYTIPDAANRRLISERLNVKLHFTNKDWMVICDGTGRLFLIKTNNRAEDSEWKSSGTHRNGVPVFFQIQKKALLLSNVEDIMDIYLQNKEVYTGFPLGEDTHMTVLYSVLRSNDKTCFVDILCLDVIKNPDSTKDIHASSFLTKLEWLTLTSDNENCFELSRRRTLQTLSCPDYAVINPCGTQLILSCEKLVRFTYDSLKPIEKPEAEVNSTKEVEESEKDENLKDEMPPAYTWTQRIDELVVYFKLPSEVSKSDISFALESSHVDLKVNNAEQPLLNGDLFGKVVVSDCTWTLNDEHILELFLSKVDKEMEWSAVVIGDSRGQRVFDAEQLALINEQLAPYTSDAINPDPQSFTQPAFNSQELEECDAFPDDSASLVCLDGETHEIIQQVNLSSHQWLFSASSAAEKFPVLCLRHDVDGVVWQPSYNETGELVWNHVSTFNAFGYVQASKQQKKFTICSPDFSYVAISDCVRHIYVYRQPAAIVSPVRNRKTGETVGAIAKQQVVALESVDNIDGVFATDKNIFALSGKLLYAVRVNND